MKKMIAMMMAMLMLVISCAAMAETAEAPVVMDAAASEAYLTENGIEGEFMTFEQVYLKMFMPSNYSEYELTEEEVADGMVGVYMDDEETHQIGMYYYDVEGLTLDQFKADLIADEEQSFTEENFQNVQINGLDALLYDDVEDESSWAVFSTQAGYLFSIYFTPVDPADEAFTNLACAMIASIQVEEQPAA